MKLRRLFTISLILAGSLTPLMATKEQPISKPPITLVKKNKSSISMRPKMPDRQVVTCQYDGDDIVLDFTVSEGICILTLTDINQYSRTWQIDTESLSVRLTVGQLEGPVIIELDTELGNSFSGVLE